MSKKKIFAVCILSLAAVVIVLSCLAFYTPFILVKTYDRETDAFKKNWFINPIEFISAQSLHLWRDNVAAVLNVLFANQPPIESSIPTVKLWVANNDLEVLNQQIYEYGLGDLAAKVFPGPKKVRLKGTFEGENGRYYRVSFGLRGAREGHHMTWKPSLRIKFKKTAFPDGYRDQILLVLEDGVGLRNWLSGYLSQQWGMLGPDEHFIRLFINNKYMGLYNRLRRLDESLFINFKKLPGPIFRLEHTDKRYLNRIWWNWYLPQFWEKIGVDPGEGTTILNRPIGVAQEILNKKPFQGHPAILNKLLVLNELIDQESFAKYLAILTHGGETHVDGMHNNAFWLDTPSGKIIAFLVDINGYDFPVTVGDQMNRPIIKPQGAFVQAWMRHPANFSLYIDRLYELINSFGAAKNLEGVIRNQWKKIRPHALSDLHTGEVASSFEGTRLLSVTSLDENVESLIQFIRLRNQRILNQLIDDHLSLIQAHDNRFEVFIEGYSGVIVKRKDGRPFQLYRKKKWVSRATLLPYLNLMNNKINDFPQVYGFYELPGRPEDYIFIHRLTSAEIFLTPFQYNHYLKILKRVKGINPLSIPELDTSEIILGPGELVFNQTKEFNLNQPVTIYKGTTIKLGVGVSLIFKGPVNIEGTQHQPVMIRPLDPGKPFGVVALFGKETTGSRIRYLDIEGGSVHQRHNLKFTGMFSVHDCPDIEIRGSRFGKNFIGDDAVHIVHSKAIIENSVFEHAHADALDWDLVDGSIVNSRFAHSGNDGMDLSMGNVNIIGSHFEDAGDKCISAGEGTEVFVEDSVFINCETGIAVKDSSKLTLDRGTFIGNGIAWNSYKKKWRWQTGGTGEIKNSQFIGSIEADISGDKFSRVNFEGDIPGNLKIKGKISVTTSGS